jgi:ABC-type Fe3+ transport system substrate-binding protein
MDISRRSFLRWTGLAGAAALGAIACTPAAPSDMAAPPAGATPASGAENWQAQWNALIVAARAEGTFSVVTTSGAAYKNFLDEFQAVFPGVEPQYNVVPTFAQWNPKILAERQAGVYNWDLVNHAASEVLAPGTVGAASGAAAGGARGGLDPVKPLIFRPDVLNDDSWVDGSFDAGWLDIAKEYGYGFTANVGGDLLWANGDLVSEGEINSFQDLLNPKWQGKIELQDPRVSGWSYTFLTSLRLNQGNDDMMRQLLVDQKPIIATDPRQTTERLIRGVVAVASGPSAESLLPFKQQGLTDKLRLLRLPEVQFKQVSTGFWYINRAPHPNATKLFVNWTLTREGQQAYVKHVLTNSRRKDVDPGDPNTVLVPGKTYKTRMITEESIDEINRTKAVATEMLK